MQTIKEVMTREVQSISPQETIQRAAQMMDELNVGSIPVLDGQKLVGMITDRDITVRATAAGQAPGSTRVGDVMSTDVRTCSPNQTVDEVLGQMGDVQIRRVPVVDENSQQVVGIVSMGIALVVGVLGTLVGSMITGLDPVWNATPAEFGLIVLGSVLAMVFGFMLGVLIRNSSGASTCFGVRPLRSTLSELAITSTSHALQEGIRLPAGR